MGCSSCNGEGTKPMFGGIKKAASNLGKAAAAQPKKIEWFKQGARGLIKCFNHSVIYSDEDIKANRDVCRECPHSTKEGGKLTTLSQCMAPDPKRNGAPCGCFVVCKTQSDTCPLNLFKSVPITLNKEPL